MKRLLPAFLLAAAFFAAGEARGACAPDSGVVIYYGNGMFITPARARVQALMMDRKIRPALRAGVKATFSYSYNNNESDNDQLLQVVGQAVLGKSSFKLPSVPSWVPDLSSSAQEAINAIEQSAKADTYVKDPDLNAQVARYTADLATGKRVVVLAHSQGNFYANKAYDRLPSTAGFGIVSVGTPASFTAGNGPYTTLTNDEVIKPIPNHKAANTSNGAAFVKATNSDGHSFTGSYLSGDVSGPKILAQVNATLAALSCPVTPF